MAKFQCPLCRVNFEGSIWDITPQIIGHSDGSHKLLYSEEDAHRIVAEQANPVPTVEMSPPPVLPPYLTDTPAQIIKQHDQQVVEAVSVEETPTTSPSTSPSTTETTETVEVHLAATVGDLTPEQIAPLEAVTPPPAPEVKPIENLDNKDQAVDSWWDRILGKDEK